MQDVKSFISPYFFDDNPKETMEGYLSDIGFKNFNVEIQERHFTFETDELFMSKKKKLVETIQFSNEIFSQISANQWINLPSGCRSACMSSISRIFMQSQKV